jgi:hypothetical protein
MGISVAVASNRPSVSFRLLNSSSPASINRPVRSSSFDAAPTYGEDRANSRNSSFSLR